MNKSISLVIPTYKEHDNIALLVERIDKAMSGADYSVLFVDDNSRDGTEELVNTLAQKYPVKILVRTNKRGLSSAVVDGLMQTDGDIVGVMDADLQHPPEIWPEMVKALNNGSDMVVASRYAKGGSPGDWTLSRKLISFVANTMALPLAPKVKDRMSGCFGFKRSAVDLKSLNAVGWKIGLEIMTRGKFSSMTEVPYTFVPRARGTSKLSNRIMGQYIKQLLRLYLDKFQIVNFMMVGGIGYGINILAYSLLTPLFQNTETTFLGQHFYLPPFVISSLLAIASNYYLNKVWTFRRWKEQKLGALRYLSMALVTLLFDLVVLSLLVDKGGLPPVPAAALAILIVFVLRFVIARKWVWKQSAAPQK